MFHVKDTRLIHASVNYKFHADYRGTNINTYWVFFHTNTRLQTNIILVAIVIIGIFVAFMITIIIIITINIIIAIILLSFSL